MNKLVTNIEIEKIIHDNEMVLVYFGGESCGVCRAMQSKVEEILKDYPGIKSAEVDVEKSIMAAASYSVFTIPVILLFINGRETIREARHISIRELDNKIARYYAMIFQ